MFNCPICGKQTIKATRDHLVPKKYGAPLSHGNSAIFCEACNTLKKDYTIFEFPQYLIRLANISSPEKEEIYLKMSAEARILALQLNPFPKEFIWRINKKGFHRAEHVFNNIKHCRDCLIFNLKSSGVDRIFNCKHKKFLKEKFFKDHPEFKYSVPVFKKKSRDIRSEWYSIG